MPSSLQAAAIVLVLAGTTAGLAEETALFVVARNKNANVVEYSARSSADGRLEAGTPIDVHWFLRAEDGRRADLSLFERLLAYGIHFQLDASHDGGALQIVSLPARRIQVRRGSSGYQAETAIDGSPARLRSIFVTAQDGGGLPRVLSIELRGERLSDGAPALERIVPP